jgi:translation initiation factor 1 (eIF-1/SUI1)
VLKSKLAAGLSAIIKNISLSGNHKKGIVEAIDKIKGFISLQKPCKYFLLHRLFAHC